jgi:hypothetical protein
MDEKKVGDILDKEIKRLEKTALTSTDACVVAQYIAFSDKRVRDLFSLKLKEGYRFRGVRSLNTISSTPDHKRVFVEFDSGEDTFCLVPPSFLAIVSMDAHTLVGEPVDNYCLKPGETYIPYSQTQGLWPWTQVSSPGFEATYSRSFTEVPYGYQRMLTELPLGYPRMQELPIGYSRMHEMQMGYPRMQQQLPIEFSRLQELSRINEEARFANFRETGNFFPRPLTEVDRLWTPEARILPVTPGTVRLTAAIAVPNSCYIEGRAQLGVPQDHQILPEQIGVILPIEYTDQPICMQYIKHLSYDVTFDINEAKTGVVIFSVLHNRVVGYAYCDLPQFIRMQQQSRQQQLMLR